MQATARMDAAAAIVRLLTMIDADELRGWFESSATVDPKPPAFQGERGRPGWAQQAGARGDGGEAGSLTLPEFVRLMQRLEGEVAPADRRPDAVVVSGAVDLFKQMEPRGDGLLKWCVPPTQRGRARGGRGGGVFQGPF